MKNNNIFLLIEDNPIDQIITRQLFKKVLDINDLNIVNNGLEGINWITDAVLDKPLIVLLDINMPIMNGFEFLEVFKNFSDEIKANVDIYILSSTLDPNEIEKIKTHDLLKGHLIKPFSPKEFEAIIQHKQL